MKLRQKRGITLIALIITIIVLLILAGVTISMVVGDNGVLKQAQNAKIKTEKAKDQELRGLTAAEAGGNLEMTWHIEKYEDDGKEEEIKVPVPAYFAVSQVEGENSISDGLVVIDSNGNEFVWIPCGSWRSEKNAWDPLIFGTAKSYVSNNSWSQYQYTNKTWKNTDSKGNCNTGDDTEGVIEMDSISDTNIAMKSIKKYGGFYVARFEAGVPSNADFYVSTNGSSNGEEYKGKNGTSGTSPDSNGFTTTRYDRKDENLKPVSKRYNQVWNYIDQTTAKKVSEKMYEDNDDVDSYLIDSNAWNYICKDIFGQDEILGEEGIKKSTTYGNYLDNTTTDYTSLDCLWANHKVENSNWKYATKYGKGHITSDIVNGRNSEIRIELATGASNDFKLYNIYDMAGNIWEWTEETATDGSTTYGAVRGGSFSDGGTADPVVHAFGGRAPTFDGVHLGFRPVLYVK